jgi:hypothetical protein
MMVLRVLPHPHPSSPIKGEAPLHPFCSIQSQKPAGFSPLMGEVRWGCSGQSENADV